MTIQEAVAVAPVFSAVAASIAALIAVIAVLFAGVQILLARKTATIQVVQTFDKAAAEREAALASAADANKKEHAFNEFLNFLELYAALCNRSLVFGIANEIIRDRLIDSVIVLERAPAWHEKIDRAIYHHETFSHLRQFVQKNKRILDERRTVAAGRPP